MTHLRTVLEQFPRDRVVHNELGRVLFLQKRYADAVKEFEQTLSIDPEDLQAHYNLMLCYNGLGDDAKANEHKARYLRFKADESAQAITGPCRCKGNADVFVNRLPPLLSRDEFGVRPGDGLADSSALNRDSAPCVRSLWRHRPRPL